MFGRNADDAAPGAVATAAAADPTPQSPPRVARLQDILSLLRNGQRPHDADYELWPWCFMKEVSPADATLLEIWIAGASPTATPSQRNRLDKTLARFAEMAEWHASVMASRASPRTTPEQLVDLLDRGSMPPADAYGSAYAALELPLTTAQAALVHSYLNGAARGASPWQRRDLVSRLSERFAVAPPGRRAGTRSAPSTASSSASKARPAATNGVPSLRAGPPEVARTVQAMRKLLAESPAAATDANPWRHFPLPMSDDGAARLLYQAVVGASTDNTEVQTMSEAGRMAQCAVHLEACIDAAEREGSVDARSAVAMRQALPRVRAAIGLIGEFPSALAMQRWFFGQTLGLSAESRQPGAEQSVESIELLAGPLTHWTVYISTKTFINHGFLDLQTRMIDRAAEVGLISPEQKRQVINYIAAMLETFHNWDGGNIGESRIPSVDPNAPRRISVYPSNPQMVMQRLRADHGFDDARLAELRDDIKAHFDEAPGYLDSIAFYRKYSPWLAGTIGSHGTRRAWRVLSLAIHQALTGAFS